MGTRGFLVGRPDWGNLGMPNTECRMPTGCVELHCWVQQQEIYLSTFDIRHAAFPFCYAFTILFLCFFTSPNKFLVSTINLAC